MGEVIKKTNTSGAHVEILDIHFVYPVCLAFATSTTFCFQDADDGKSLCQCLLCKDDHESINSIMTITLSQDVEAVRHSASLLVHM